MFEHSRLVKGKSNNYWKCKKKTYFGKRFEPNSFGLDYTVKAKAGETYITFSEWVKNLVEKMKTNGIKTCFSFRQCDQSCDQLSLLHNSIQLNLNSGSV